VENQPEEGITALRNLEAYGLEYAYFCRKVKELSGIDLGSYKSHQVHRRLESYRNRKGIPSFLAFAKAIEEDRDKLKEVLDFLTINVSEFFRNPVEWGILRERVLPDLTRRKSGGRLRAWSAGCSGGQEPYSLAMLLEETVPGKSYVLGTDIDRESLKKAVTGTYSLDEVRGVPGDFLEKYFLSDGPFVRVIDRLKAVVAFAHHNLLADPYPEGMDLILCRNVLIYFSDDSKRKIISKLVRALSPGGFLFVGASEAILTPRVFGLAQVYPFFYCKVQ